MLPASLGLFWPIVSDGDQEGAAPLASRLTVVVSLPFFDLLREAQSRVLHNDHCHEMSGH